MQGADDEPDPLDAFMSGINNEVSDAQASKAASELVQQVDEVDPLDAFMSGVNNEIKQKANEPQKAQRCDSDDDDDTMMSYLKARKEKATKVLLAEKAKETGTKLGAGFKLVNEAANGNDSDEEVALGHATGA